MMKGCTANFALACARAALDGAAGGRGGEPRRCAAYVLVRLRGVLGAAPFLAATFEIGESGGVFMFSTFRVCVCA